MCTSNSFGNSLVPYGLKIQAPYPVGLSPGAALELQRSQAAAQLYDYGARIRLGLHYAAAAAAAAAAGHHPPPAPGFGPYHHGPDPLALMYAKHCDPRLRFLHEEPKPSHSYIGLIAMAILSSKENKMVLSDIYQWILDNYAYFRTRGPGWRNSIRHNLSLNDCFVKAGRSANGKGHYWAIHPANVEDFRKGDFRRRRAQRKVRKAMGLAVPEDDEDSPSPPPAGPQNEHPHAPGPASIHWAARVLGSNVDQDDQERAGSPERGSPDPKRSREGEKEENAADGGAPEEASDGTNCEQSAQSPKPVAPPPAKRRMFDVDSLLAPDKRDTDSRLHASLTYYGRPLPPSLPHPGFLPHGHHLLPPGSHLLQRDMVPNHLQQLHGDIGSPERSRALAIDVGNQENEDAASPKASPDRESRKRPLSCGDNNSSGGESDPSRSRGESPGSGSGSRMTAVSRADSPVSRMASWIPMMGGSWKDHPSAFRSTMPHGHRLVWGQLATGSGQVIWGQLASGSSASQTMSGAGLLRIPPPPPGPR